MCYNRHATSIYCGSQLNESFDMIWIVTDTLARAVYVLAYLPVMAITAVWCLWRTITKGAKSVVAAATATAKKN
jgi:hypothetical protein